MALATNATRRRVSIPGVCGVRCSGRNSRGASKSQSDRSWGEKGRAASWVSATTVSRQPAISRRSWQATSRRVSNDCGTREAPVSDQILTQQEMSARVRLSATASRKTLPHVGLVRASHHPSRSGPEQTSGSGAHAKNPTNADHPPAWTRLTPSWSFCRVWSRPPLFPKDDH